MILLEAPTAIELPAQLDLTAAAPLAETLKAARGHPVAIDASQVERLGALCLQVLLASRTTWSADSQPFQIHSPSQAFQDAAALFGADLQAA